jgi:dienelactone hydrolase
MFDKECVSIREWSKIFRFIFLASNCFLTTICFSSCSTINSSNNPSELIRTFEHATIVIPKHINPADPFSSKRVLIDEVKNIKNELNNIPSDNALPLIIYLHGCYGRSPNDFPTFQFLARNGYAVLAPDSYAREYRPISCDPESRRGGLFRGALSFRLAEAKYAYDEAKKMQWVDKKNIFMMGFSEGGIATAKYSHGGLAGRIIIGWTCNHLWPEYSGISGPQDEPILAVVASKDPWFSSPFVYGYCRNSPFSQRELESIVIESNFHAVHIFTSVKKKILQFLQENKRY